MQFGIAARQPADIAPGRRGFVAQRGERHDLRSRSPPSIENVCIDKRKRLVGGECDALTGRLQRGGRRLGAGQRRCHRHDGVEVEMPRGDLREALKPRRKVRVLAGLHEAKMPLRQHQSFVARDCAQHRDAKRRQCVRDQRPVPVAAELVQHHATDPHGRVVGGEARGDGGGRLRLARHIEDQKNRKAETRRQIGCRARAASPSPARRRTIPSPLRSPAHRRPGPYRRSAHRSTWAASPRCRG